jgi:Family of unknown function (DUF6152)
MSMSNNRKFARSGALLMGVWLLAVAGSSAHHSGAMFEFTNCQSMSGTVRALEFQYPHSWLWVVMPVEGADPQVWGFEFMSPLQAMGIDKRWKKDVVKKGDRVTVYFGPHREGKPAGALAAVKLPDNYLLRASPGICRGMPELAGTREEGR